MEFSDFFDIMWTYLADPESKESNKEGRPEFLKNLIDMLIREPQTEEEDQKAENGDLNPLNNKEADTINKYCSGSRKIPKKDAKDILKRISDGNRFFERIVFAAPGAKKGIRDELRKRSFNVTSASLGKVCFDIMKAFLEKFKEGKSSVTESDIADDKKNVTYLKLVHDVQFKCPLCGRELITDGDTEAIAGYDVVHIFPANLSMEGKAEFSKIKKAPENSDALENKIPLCLNCANLYLENPTLKNYQTLVNEKRRIDIEHKLAKGLNQLTLEDNLIKAIKGLKEIKPDKITNSISYDAHKIEEKINNDYPLQGAVQFYVMGYYNKIRDQFSSMEGNSFSFDDLATTIKLAYIKFKREGLSQSEVFNHLAHWILDKEHLENDFIEAARILVAFFVQNCEVFEVENAQ
ncbi:ABC-three component system protein [Lactobacillus gasseri ATCC 33323 = JCM 1131]|jgi:hypothetical protein|nr:ABC-three component system protein [Lactobacillus gasseri]KAB1920756.1 hypothetical protein F8228_03545 [Lactobacillus gasseri ATCC 33323 = JCM 1131]MDG9741709.1 hypothetical protein [Lactobacillus gasseri ATCC 33323 = JCM 1131]MDQ4446866.1 hypothetical protein [Lactobacillus gasseri]STX22428.1 Zn-ribbon containing protein [Lactobacillus gasseri]